MAVAGATRQLPPGDGGSGGGLGGEGEDDAYEDPPFDDSEPFEHDSVYEDDSVAAEEIYNRDRSSEYVLGDTSTSLDNNEVAAAARAAVQAMRDAEAAEAQERAEPDEAAGTAVEFDAAGYDDVGDAIDDIPAEPHAAGGGAAEAGFDDDEEEDAATEGGSDTNVVVRAFSQLIEQLVLADVEDRSAYATEIANMLTRLPASEEGNLVLASSRSRAVYYLDACARNAPEDTTLQMTVLCILVNLADMGAHDQILGEGGLQLMMGAIEHPDSHCQSFALAGLMNMSATGTMLVMNALTDGGAEEVLMRLMDSPNEQVRHYAGSTLHNVRYYRVQHARYESRRGSAIPAAERRGSAVSAARTSGGGPGPDVLAELARADAARADADAALAAGPAAAEPGADADEDADEDADDSDDDPIKQKIQMLVAERAAKEAVHEWAALTIHRHALGMLARLYFNEIRFVNAASELAEQRRSFRRFARAPPRTGSGSLGAESAAPAGAEADPTPVGATALEEGSSSADASDEASASAPAPELQLVVPPVAVRADPSPDDDDDRRNTTDPRALMEFLAGGVRPGSMQRIPESALPSPLPADEPHTLPAGAPAADGGARHPDAASDSAHSAEGAVGLAEAGASASFLSLGEFQYASATATEVSHAKAGLPDERPRPPPRRASLAADGTDAAERGGAGEGEGESERQGERAQGGKGGLGTRGGRRRSFGGILPRQTEWFVTSCAQCAGAVHFDPVRGGKTLVCPSCMHVFEAKHVHRQAEVVAAIRIQSHSRGRAARLAQLRGLAPAADGAADTEAEAVAAAVRIQAHARGRSVRRARVALPGAPAGGGAPSDVAAETEAAAVRIQARARGRAARRARPQAALAAVPAMGETADAAAAPAASTPPRRLRRSFGGILPRQTEWFVTSCAQCAGAVHFDPVRGGKTLVCPSCMHVFEAKHVHRQAEVVAAIRIQAHSRGRLSRLAQLRASAAPAAAGAAASAARALAQPPVVVVPSAAAPATASAPAIGSSTPDAAAPPAASTPPRRLRRSFGGILPRQTEWFVTSCAQCAGAVHFDPVRGGKTLVCPSCMHVFEAKHVHRQAEVVAAIRIQAHSRGRLSRLAQLRRSAAPAAAAPAPAAESATEAEAERAAAAARIQAHSRGRATRLARARARPTPAADAVRRASVCSYDELAAEDAWSADDAEADELLRDLAGLGDDDAGDGDEGSGHASQEGAELPPVGTASAAALPAVAAAGAAAPAPAAAAAIDSAADVAAAPAASTPPRRLRRSFGGILPRQTEWFVTSCAQCTGAVHFDPVRGGKTLVCPSCMHVFEAKHVHRQAEVVAAIRIQSHSRGRAARLAQLRASMAPPATAPPADAAATSAAPTAEAQDSSTPDVAAAPAASTPPRRLRRSFGGILPRQTEWFVTSCAQCAGAVHFDPVRGGKTLVCPSCMHVFEAKHVHRQAEVVAAIRIQSHSRGRLSRLAQLRASALGAPEAAAPAADGAVDAEAEAVAAAVRIQAHARGRSVRRARVALPGAPAGGGAPSDVAAETEAAAVRIQARARGRAARRARAAEDSASAPAGDFNLEMEAAAVRIQSHSRGRSARLAHGRRRPPPPATPADPTAPQPGGTPAGGGTRRASACSWEDEYGDSEAWGRDDAEAEALLNALAELEADEVGGEGGSGRASSAEAASPALSPRRDLPFDPAPPPTTTTAAAPAAASSSSSSARTDEEAAAEAEPADAAPLRAAPAVDAPAAVEAERRAAAPAPATPPSPSEPSSLPMAAPLPKPSAAAEAAPEAAPAPAPAASAPAAAEEAELAAPAAPTPAAGAALADELSQRWASAVRVQRIWRGWHSRTRVRLPPPQASWSLAAWSIDPGTYPETSVLLSRSSRTADAPAPAGSALKEAHTQTVRRRPGRVRRSPDRRRAQQPQPQQPQQQQRPRPPSPAANLYLLPPHDRRRAVRSRSPSPPRGRRGARPQSAGGADPLSTPQPGASLHAARPRGAAHAALGPVRPRARREAWQAAATPATVDSSAVTDADSRLPPSSAEPSAVAPPDPADEVRRLLGVREELLAGLAATFDGSDGVGRPSTRLLGVHRQYVELAYISLALIEALQRWAAAMDAALSVELMHERGAAEPVPLEEEQRMLPSDFVWRGSSYLERMAADTFFLQQRARSLSAPHHLCTARLCSALELSLYTLEARGRPLARGQTAELHAEVRQQTARMAAGHALLETTPFRRERADARRQQQQQRASLPELGTEGGKPVGTLAGGAAGSAHRRPATAAGLRVHKVLGQARQGGRACMRVQVADGSEQLVPVESVDPVLMTRWRVAVTR